jgi:hypothetical protein
VFLLQIPLSAPRLGAAWRDRLLTIFLVDHGLYVRSYRPDDRSKLVALAQPATTASRVDRRDLQPMAVPYLPRTNADPDDEDGLFLDPAYFLENVPGVRSELEKYTQLPEYVLSVLLSGDPDGHLGLVDNSVLSRGDPALIQGPHEPKCASCQQPMRFLLQFPDVTKESVFGDSGVGYVYGCDAHPDEYAGFIDCC